MKVEQKSAKEIGILAEWKKEIGKNILKKWEK
jgi:hypothetical protein